MTRIGNYNFFQYKPSIKQNRQPSFGMNREVSGFVLDKMCIFTIDGCLGELNEFLKAPKAFYKNNPDKRYISFSFCNLFEDLQTQLAGYVKKVTDEDPKAIFNLPMPPQGGILAPYVKKKPDGTYASRKLNKKETLEIASLMVKGSHIVRLAGFKSEKMDTALEAIKNVHVNNAVLTDKYYDRLAGVLETIKESIRTKNKSKEFRNQLAKSVKKNADSHPDGVFIHPVNGGLKRITNISDAKIVADELMKHSTMHPDCSSLYLNTTKEKMMEMIERTRRIYLRY